MENSNNSNKLPKNPSLSQKVHIGFKHWFARYNLFYTSNGLVCVIIFFAMIFATPFLTWKFFNIFGIDIPDIVIYLMYIVGFFLGLFFASLLGYYFYSSDWTD